MFDKGYKLRIRNDLGSGEGYLYREFEGLDDIFHVYHSKVGGKVKSYRLGMI